MKRKFILLILLCFVFSSKISSQNFKFNKQIIIKYAILGMEEYYNDIYEFKKNFNIDKPLVYAKYTKDCNGKKRKIILVSFNSIKGKSNASVFLEYSKDNYFEKILSRGTSVENAKDAIDSFKKYNYTDEIFGCGI